MRIVKLTQKLPTRQLKRVRAYMSAARRVAKTIVDTQTQLYLAGNEGGKDIMSLLSKIFCGASLGNEADEVTMYAPVRANLAEDGKSKLGEEEMMAQLTLVSAAIWEGDH